MNYVLAKIEDLQTVYDVVQHTIKTVYPQYYPAEVVDFFCEHHSKDAIAKDIENGYVSILKIDGTIVATGCFINNHITRVYVLPEYQKKGFGTFIMKNIEAQMSNSYDKAYLDASLPAAALYEKMGFSTVKHERYQVENEMILVYEIMEKELHKASSAMPGVTKSGICNDEQMADFRSYMSFYKSILDQDRASVVICNLVHEIIYMNPAAKISYEKRGGDKLIGRSLLDCHIPETREKIQQVLDWFAADENHNIVYTFHNDKQNKDVYMVALREAGKLIGYYEKHEYRNAETMKPYDLW